MTKMKEKKQGILKKQRKEEFFRLNLSYDGVSLTKQEFVVIRYLLRGMTLTDISVKTKKSIKTISSQKRSAYKKLEANSDIDLLRRLLELNIISFDV
ncbi:response regulator transcription factor [Salmonella enterica subsp. enterica]|nr:response regulator transcription factor [Salmonella enterica subsp. enterica serovar Javiana]EGX7302463.1 response regulator transcription factor [Salmonella enterica]EGX8329231.1 response regulator transcription factor [Salmonella enterica subsp. enterica serovar Javiana]